MSTVAMSGSRLQIPRQKVPVPNYVLTELESNSALVTLRKDDIDVLCELKSLYRFTLPVTIFAHLLELVELIPNICMNVSLFFRL